MQYLVTRGEKGKVEVKVDVAKAGFIEAYGKVLKKLGTETKIAGFRPGKVPTEILEQKLGSGKLLNETAGTLVSKHLSEILSKEKLIPLDSPKIAIGSLAKASPFSFTATFTNKPQIKLGDWKKIKAQKVKAKEVTESDIEQSIKNIFEAWVNRKSEVGGQKSEKTTTIGDTEGEAEDDEGKGKFIYDAHGNKIYIKDEKESKSQRVKESKFKVKSGSPSTNAQDEIDDNFAKVIGARDLAHLRELVKRDLEALVANQVEAKLEQEIFDKILEIGSCDVPDILVDDEMNRILVRLNSELERQKKKLNDYLSEQNTTLDALKAKWRPQAEKNVKISLILDEIGKSEKVQVLPEEVGQALKGVSETNLSEEQRKDLERYLAFSIFQAKTLDLVKKTVTS